ncbi:MAG TPA: hypothetical protein VLF20_05375 [Patescibacteria group bacterium]|nr:hypothetical protein [Patescibacteria group bacterium]
MNKGINLLGGERLRTVSASLRQIRVVRVIALSVLFGISGLSFILFLLIALSPLPILQEQEREAKRNISEYHTDMAQLALITDRLQASKQVLSTRSDYSAVLSQLLSIMPSEITVTGLVVQQKEFTLTVSSASLLALDTFFTNIVDMSKQEELFSKTLITKFLYNETTGSYIATITMEIL